MVFRALPALIAILVMGPVALAAEGDGYRLPHGAWREFVADYDSARMVVFPAIVRTPYLTRYSAASRQLVLEHLDRRSSTGEALPADARIDLGVPEPKGQMALFVEAMGKIYEHLYENPTAADYVIVVEVLFGPERKGRAEVFGLHAFILGADGTNAFSFLLNSHHERFTDARLRTRDRTADGKEKLALRSTRIALEALQAHLDEARACALRTAGVGPPSMAAGVLVDFEAGLPTGEDEHGNALGFSTFSDGPSRVAISATNDVPASARDDAGRRALRLDVTVSGWGGFTHLLSDPTGDRWLPQDWRSADGLSFWLHGTGSGASMFIDVFDNRDPCSVRDDAERYTCVFSDDVAGWRLMTFRFDEMVRKEIGNGAPNDGFARASVHGWAVGTLETRGPRTFYIDDVSLWAAPPDTHGSDHDARQCRPLNELAMYGEREKSPWQKEADERFIATVTDRFGSREAAAEYHVRVGWNAYYAGDHALAMRRFNQAWLLDPDNRLSLWGFAVIARERGDLQTAFRFYAMTRESGPVDAKLDREFAELRDRLSD